jgi:hypothetical protein
MKVDISDKARAVTALYREFELLEKNQLEVGEQMAVLIAKQLVLAEKCRAIKQTLGELFCESIDKARGE